MAPIVSVSAGGIDVESMVSALMQIERQPIDRLTNRQAAVKVRSDAIARLRTSLQALQSQATAIVTGGVTKLTSAVSIPGAATASLSSAARAGSVTFTVDRLAQAHGLRTATTVAASSSIVTTATSLAVSGTAGRLGIGAIGVDGAANGNYAVTVTKATSAATLGGGGALAASTVITAAANDALTLEVDGVSRNLTIAAGTYTPTTLVAAVQTAIDASGGGATASLDGADRLVLTSVHEGSAATLQITGGTALGALGLSAGAAVTGGDGAIRIGTGDEVAVSSAGKGVAVPVAAGGGTLSLTVDGPLRTGAATVSVVGTGDRSLATVASAINSANAGVTAAAVKVADGAWVLQATSTATGTAGAISLDGSVFAGGLVQTSAAQDAQITIGSGAGAYTVTAAGNTFSDLLPGATLTVTATSAVPVSVTVNRDDAATADAVEKLVTAANGILSDIKRLTAYDPATRAAGPLTNDSSVRRLADQIRSAVTGIVGEQGLASTIGITTERTGQLKFDRAKFLTALAADPAGVDRLFARGGSATGGVAWAKASDRTAAGEYDVVITQAPTRATSGEQLAGVIGAARTIGVKIGAVTATYDVAAGSTAADVVAGLNAALSSAGIRVNAEVGGAGGIVLTANSHGSAGTFQLNLDVGGTGVWTESAGVDVAGTIDGTAAIGAGQRLRLPDSADSPAAGLEVDVTAGTPGAYTVEYAPGLAARLVHLAATLTDENGTLTTTASSYASQITAYTKQIERYEGLMVTREANMRRQWTAVQSLLSSLQNTGSWLSGQITSLQGSSG